MKKIILWYLFYCSLEHCIASFLGNRLQRAIEFTHLRHFWPTNLQPTIVVSGGVACNMRIRTTIEKVRKQYKNIHMYL